MDSRKKLIELILQNENKYLVYLNKVLDAAINGDAFDRVMNRVEFTVDNLIAHGVTVQELDGCQYCKEDRDGYRTMFGAFSIANPFHGNEWTINTGHCKPRQIYFCPMCGRKLPDQPKEEV